MVDQQDDPEQQLLSYLNDTCPEVKQRFRRKFCCESSRSLYCPECCQVCIPEEHFPPVISEGRLRLPFAIDILLDARERRTSSTGLQLVSLMNALRSRRKELGLECPDGNDVNLVDLAKTEMPNYSDHDEGVYVLFPTKDSVPISSVNPKKLVLLDTKWSKQRLRFHSQIRALPKVHLDAPPAESQFWRWHNSGKGMLSTIEAVYFACMDATQGKWTPEEQKDLIHIMWLFSLQRSMIHEKSELEKRVLPFTEAGKESQRILRARQTGNPPKNKPCESRSIYSSL